MIKKPDYSDFPDLNKYADLEKIDPQALVEAFKIENHYHNLLIAEKDREQRLSYYEQLYAKVIPIYDRDPNLNIGYNQKDKYVKLFRKELENKRIVDFGCGAGNMLMAIDRLLSVKKLIGIDVVIDEKLKALNSIQFIETNIIDFELEEKYDVAFSDNVIEHLVPDDALSHLKSIYKGLYQGGKLIIIMPNRLFGPWDVSRIVDFSQSGRTPALGGHVNESTHGEMNKVLKQVGFGKVSTIVPIPKLKYSLFKDVRINTKQVESIENSPFLLNLLRQLKYKGECMLKFPVTLIAEK